MNIKQLQLEKKIQICGIFMVGFFLCIVISVLALQLGRNDDIITYFIFLSYIGEIAAYNFGQKYRPKKESAEQKKKSEKYAVGVFLFYPFIVIAFLLIAFMGSANLRSIVIIILNLTGIAAQFVLVLDYFRQFKHFKNACRC